VADAIVLSDTATVDDNSHRGRASAVADFSHGFAVGKPLWPDWTPETLTLRWPRDP
jgi:predicted ABC-type ATPase